MNNLLRRTKLFVNRNASTILTCMGGVGVVATTILTVKAVPKASFLLEEAREEKGEELTTLEEVIVAGPAYIPTILVGVSTIACIFGANATNKRKQASLMSAYALLDSSFKEYRKKVNVLYGEDGDIKVRGAVAKDKFAEVDIPTDTTKRLFYDDFSGRLFESTIETVQQAEYQLNRDLSTQGSVTLNDFYVYLGIAPIDGGDELGWSNSINYDCYWQSWIDFGHHKTTMGDDLECIILTFFTEPTTDWADYG